MSVREEYETALAKNEDCVAGIPRSAHHLPLEALWEPGNRSKDH